MQLWVHANRNLGKWNHWGTPWTSTGCLICDYFGDDLHQEVLAAGGGTQHDCEIIWDFSTTFASQSFDLQNSFCFQAKRCERQERILKPPRQKTPTELCLIGTTLSLCQTNLTEFLDFHILAVCFGMVIAVSFFSCSGVRAPALLGVLLEASLSHILVWGGTRKPWRSEKWHWSLVVRTGCGFGMDKWILRALLVNIEDRMQN